MTWYHFRVLRADATSWDRKTIFAGSIEEAATRIDEWCEMNGYIDWKMEGATL